MMGFSQAELGERLGFKWTKVKDIEIGKQKLTPEIALDIENIFCISFKWLLTGQGSMTAGNLKENPESSHEQSVVDPFSAQISALLSGMSIKDKREILKSIEEKKDYAELKKMMKQILKPKVLGEAGIISINFIIIVFLPFEIVLAAVGLGWMNGSTALVLFDWLDTYKWLIIPIILILPIFKPVTFFAWLKHCYCSIIIFKSSKFGFW